MYDLLWSEECEHTEFAVSASHKVVGLFKDTGCTRFPYSFGIATEPSTHETSIIEPIHAPFLEVVGDREFMDVWRHSAVVSNARLADARVLAVQKNGPRCTGILIEHDDGHKSALGQWDAAAGPDETLYDRQRDGPLQSLHFAYEEGDWHHRYVVSISLVKLEADTGTVFTWTEFDKVNSIHTLDLEAIAKQVNA